MPKSNPKDHILKDIENIKNNIEYLYKEKDTDKKVLQIPKNKKVIQKAIQYLDSGTIRVVTPPTSQNLKWKVNLWVKKAILLYFSIAKMKRLQSGCIEYWDKIPIKINHKTNGNRVVPPAVARYGSFLEKGVILMPSYINIGAYISSGTMVDTWATVGSCAQIGKNVHLSGGVGIGGVLEPPQAEPVIIEDNAFLGSRCIVVEGVHIKKGAVLGSGVVLTSSTKIIDVSKNKQIIYKKEVPENSVVIPGNIEKEFAAGKYFVPVALIIGKRKESTDIKTSLNETLREFELSV